MRSPLMLACLALTSATSTLAAQYGETRGEHPEMGHDQPHQTAFSQGPRAGWTLARPHLDLNGGLFYVNRDPDDTREAFVRLHAQTAPGIPGLELASDLAFLPSQGATPTWSAVAQIAPLRSSSPLYLSGGFGVITGRHRTRDRLKGWMQAVIAIRTPIHEVAPFVQIGRATGSGYRAEFLFGVAHPLAPYRFHLP